MQYVHTHRFTLDKFLKCGFADTGDRYDVPLRITAALKKEPKLFVADHQRASLHEILALTESSVRGGFPTAYA